MVDKPGDDDRASCALILERGIERLAQRILDLHPNPQHISKQALEDILSSDPGLLALLSIVRGVNQSWDLTNDETGDQVPIEHMAGCGLMDFMFGAGGWDEDDIGILDGPAV